MNNQITATGKRGGKRPNSGIKKGYKYQTTLEKKSVIAEIQQRTMRHANKLWNAQYQRAVGSMMIYRRDVTIDKKGNEKYEYVHVTDADEIQDFLNEHDGANGVTNESYYFITDVPPDNKAIDSMFDRTFGKAQQTVEVIDSPQSLTDEQLARELLRRMVEKYDYPKDVLMKLIKEEFPSVEVEAITLE